MKNENVLLPCQKLWLNNKIYDLFGEIYRESPCVGKDGKRLICHQYEDNIADEEIANTILDGCAQYCPFSCDIERILQYRNSGICIEASNTLWSSCDHESA